MMKAFPAFLDPLVGVHLLDQADIASPAFSVIPLAALST
jgi:hypothetical protein